MRSRSTSHRTRANAGFTVIEIIVALAVLIVVLALGLFVSLDVYRGYTYRSERATVVALLTRARSHALANIDQSPWGLCEEGGASYKLFRGAGYSASAHVAEEVPVAPAGQVTGIPGCAPGAGIVFSQLTGTTTPTVITVEQSTGPVTITINEEGTIVW